MSSRKFSLEAYFLIKARSETPTYRFNSVGHCSNPSPAEYGRRPASPCAVHGAVTYVFRVMKLTKKVLLADVAGRVIQ